MDAGENFEDVIDNLDRALKVLDFGIIQDGGLTTEVKALFESLRKVYGEPIQNNDVHIIGPGGGSRGDWNIMDFAWIIIFLAIPLSVIVYVISPKLENNLYQKPLIAGWLLVVMIGLIVNSRRRK